MPFRASMGGIFGSGLYPKQPPAGNAGDIIDAVTRGATTLIGSAYARKQADRQRAREDAELARRDRMEQNALEQQTRANARQDRLDQAAEEERQAKYRIEGYTPSHTETRSTVTPGSVEPGPLIPQRQTINQAFQSLKTPRAEQHVTAPSIKTEQLKVPGSYDPTKSGAYTLKLGERTRKVGENARVLSGVYKDKKSPDEIQAMAEASVDNPGVLDDFLKGAEPKAWHPTSEREAIDVAGATASARASAATGAGSPKARNAYVLKRAADLQRRKLGVDLDKPRYSRVEAERVAGEEYDRVVEGMSSEPSNEHPPSNAPRGGQSGRARDGGGDINLGTTNPGATPTPHKPDGSTVRHGTTPDPVKKDGATVRPSGSGTAPEKETITQAEAKALRDRGFTDEKIASKYIVR